MWALYAIDTLVPFESGRRLGPIAECTAKNVPQMEEFGLKSQVWLTRTLWQLMLNLMGDAEDVLVLEGKGMNKENFENAIEDIEKMKIVVQ